MKKILLSLTVATLVASCDGHKHNKHHDHHHKSHHDKHHEHKHKNHHDKKYSKKSFLTTYANIALANYSDALTDAKTLAVSLKAFEKSPSAITMQNAKNAWLLSRESYGQTEIFRLSNGPIDSESGWVADTYGAPEGQLNAWPLDENMIDYTIDANGKKTSGNIIDTNGVFTPSGDDAKSVSVAKITTDAIANLNENGGDANVATGYHAIEFLLWGQDQDYSNFIKDTITSGALTAGQRPLSDFTTDTNAQRRFDYLNAATNLIISDLQTMVDAWEKDNNSNYRAALLGYHADKSKNIDKEVAKSQIFAGMGVFIKSELANERIAVAVLTPSEEDEHSCFSDNTHRDIATNYQGFKNILFGTYNSVDYGKGAIAKLKNKTQIMNLISSANQRVSQIDITANTSRHFDYQIRPNDPQSGEITKLKNTFRKIGDMMVIAAESHDIKLGAGDVTD